MPACGKLLALLAENGAFTTPLCISGCIQQHLHLRSGSAYNLAKPQARYASHGWETSDGANILSVPDQRQAYKDKWVSYRDWLGYGEGEPESDEFLAFEEAREIVREVGLGSYKGWWEWS